MGHAATDNLDLNIAVFWISLSPSIRTSLSLHIATNIEPLSLPPEGVFQSFDALFLSLQEHGILAGCAYIIKKSERRDGR